MQESFIKQVEEHQNIIHKVINLYVQNPSEKPDLYQEILLQAWHSFPTFKAESKFSTWLYRVAFNTAITFVRKQKKSILFSGGQDLQYLTELPDTDEGENIRLLYRMIARLSPMDKALIMLYIDNLEYAEIAAITGLSMSNVGVKINRIKGALKKESRTYTGEL